MKSVYHYDNRLVENFSLSIAGYKHDYLISFSSMLIADPVLSCDELKNQNLYFCKTATFILSTKFVSNSYYQLINHFFSLKCLLDKIMQVFLKSKFISK